MNKYVIGQVVIGIHLVYKNLDAKTNKEALNPVTELTRSTNGNPLDGFLTLKLIVSQDESTATMSGSMLHSVKAGYKYLNNDPVDKEKRLAQIDVPHETLFTPYDVSDSTYHRVFQDVRDVLAEINRGLKHPMLSEEAKKSLVSLKDKICSYLIVNYKIKPIFLTIPTAFNNEVDKEVVVLQNYDADLEALLEAVRLADEGISIQPGELDESFERR